MKLIKCYVSGWVPEGAHPMVAEAVRRATAPARGAARRDEVRQVALAACSDFLACEALLRACQSYAVLRETGSMPGPLAEVYPFRLGASDGAWRRALLDIGEIHPTAAGIAYALEWLRSRSQGDLSTVAAAAVWVLGGPTREWWARPLAARAIARLASTWVSVGEAANADANAADGAARIAAAMTAMEAAESAAASAKVLSYPQENAAAAAAAAPGVEKDCALTREIHEAARAAALAAAEAADAAAADSTAGGAL